MSLRSDKNLIAVSLAIVSGLFAIAGVLGEGVFSWIMIACSFGGFAYLVEAFEKVKSNDASANNTQNSDG